METLETNASTMWLKALQDVVTYGETSYPRGTTCLELVNYHMTTPMKKPINTVPLRKIGYKFMFAEAAWILSGDNRVETIAPYSKKISEFSDDGVTFFGSYGVKIKDQLGFICKTLAADHWSRQAVLTIWREKPPKTKDTPCTISAQFLIRNGMLHCIDNMRSSDIWLGIPYDTFNFSMLSSYIILWLYEFAGISLQLGDLYLNLGSLHLYKENFKGADECLRQENRGQHKFSYRALNPIKEFGGTQELIDHLWSVAQDQPTESNWRPLFDKGE